MTYQDEDIITERQNRMREKRDHHAEDVLKDENSHSIYEEEIRIFRVPIRFIDQEILDGKAMMRIPEDFKLLSDEEIRKKFSIGSAPKFVYANRYLDFSLILNLLEQPMSDSEILDFSRSVKMILNRISSRHHIISEEVLKRVEGNLLILKMLMKTLDGANHATMFFASVENKLLIGNLVFEQTYTKRLCTITNEMAASFRVIRKEEV